MADIFLSYAREDEARAAVVARVLGELGWSVFWDRRIVAGTSWDEVVERELQACRCVVVLWSATSIASRWVKTEARFALQRSTLVPANLDRSEPPLEFRFLESAQLLSWQGATDDSEFSVLSEGIAQHVKPAPYESGVGTGSSRGQQDDALGVAHLTPPPDPKKPGREALAKRRTVQLEASLQEARQLLAQGQLQLALDTCQQALTLDESHVGALRLEEEIESALRLQASSQRATAGFPVSAETVSPALNVEPIATPIAAPKGERALTVPPSFDAAVAVDEAARIVGSEVQSNITDGAQELGPQQSWPSRLRQHWIPIASAAVVVIAAVVMYPSTGTGPPVSNTPTSTPPTATIAPPEETPAGRSSSGGDGNVKTEALIAVTSPTPKPVPFGAPVRFRADLWSLPDEPLLGFVEIPAGPFTMGSDKRQDPDAEANEFQQHKVDLPRYYIGRYEVTVAQFRAFVQASRYKARPTQKQDGQADLPVAGVTWHDALAYATWLDKSLRESRATPAEMRSILTGGQPCRVTLPSEAEWEKAARGLDARVYPWGGPPWGGNLDRAKANLASSGKAAHNTPVGSHPDRASPYGVLDMSGNVWEWTRSLWGAYEGNLGRYPYDPNDSRREDLKAPDTAYRVVRGGSSYYGDHNTRAAYRIHFLPNTRLDDDDSFGFRVGVSCSARSPAP